MTAPSDALVAAPSPPRSRFLRDRSVGFKLTLLATVPCLTALLLTCCVVAFSVFYDFRAAEVAALSSTADSLAYSSSAALEFGDKKGAMRILASQARNPHIIGAALFTREGELFAQYVRPGQSQEFNPSARHADGADTTLTRIDTYTPVTDSAAPETRDADRSGTLVIRSDLDGMWSRLRHSALLALLAAGFACLLAYFIGRSLRAVISDPVAQLTQTAAAISTHNNYSVRADDFGHNEFGQLGRTFNAMLDWIQDRDQELRDAREQLEARVRERTAELATTNQKLMQATEAALAASEAKSAFLANMSHEIRTPMNGVIGYLEILAKCGLRPLEAEYIESAFTSAHELLHIINDILDITKVESGKLQLEAVSFNLRQLLETLTEMMGIQGDKKDIEVNSPHFDEDVPQYVVGDKTRLLQVLTNLYGNAIKFTPQGGHVALATTFVSKTDNTITLRFEVSDTGIGIPADSIDSLFQPFVQVDASTTRRFGGTGLGLSISKRLVALMGGEISVTSIPDEGSKFFFTAQFGIASGHTEPSIRTLTGLNGRQRVLIVDDNARNRAVLSEQLKQFDIPCVCVDSAQKAIETLLKAHSERRPFDTALLDHQMEGCDGEELAKTINADERISSTRLILLSSSAHREDQHRFADLGFAGFLIKPVMQRNLIDGLSTVLSGVAHDWHDKTNPLVTVDYLEEHSGREDFRILVVEDNSTNRKVACAILSQLGYRNVAIAVDGREGVQRWEELRPNLILMDCQMPKMDGYAATKAIRLKESPSRSTIIVALTADVMTGTKERCIAAGMDGFLSKPIVRANLAECLEEHLKATKLAAATTAGAAPEPRPALTAPEQAPSPKQAPVDLIDWSTLRGIAPHPTDFKELLDDYLKNSTLLWADLTSAADSGTLDGAERCAHQFKGASLMIGATGAGAFLRELEIAARANDLETFKALLRDKGSIIADTQQCLRTPP